MALPGSKHTAQPARGRGPRTAGVLAAALILNLPPMPPMPQGQAAELAFEPDIRATTEVNSNRRLTTQPHDTVLGALLDLDAIFAARTERTSAELRPQVRAERYTDDAGVDLDNEDYVLSLMIGHSGERSFIQIESELARESLLRTEIFDTGILRTDANRVTFSVSPSWIYAVTEYDTLNVGFSASTIKNDAVGLVDYSFKSVSLGWTHQLTEKDEVSFTLFQSVFRVPDTGSKSRSAGFQVGYTRLFSETLMASASVGLLTSNQQFRSFQQIFPGFFIPVADETNDKGMLASFSVEKTFERSRLSADFNRAVSPSGAGFLQQSDEFNVNASHRFLQRLTGNAGFALRMNSALNPGTTVQRDRDYYSLRAGLNYRLSEEWSLAGGYRYATQSFLGVNQDDPESNQVFLTLAYNGLKRAIQH